MANIYASEAGGEKLVGNRLRDTIPLHKAVEIATPGSVINLAADTYRTPIKIKTSGTKANPITIRSSIELKRAKTSPVPNIPGFFGAYNDGNVSDGPFSNKVVMDGGQRPDFGGQFYQVNATTFAFFTLINVEWIVFEGMEFKNCWPCSFYLEGARHVTIRDVAARHGKYFAYAEGNGKSDVRFILLDRVRWVQDPNMDMWTGRATWKEVKGQSYVDKMYFGGALLGGHDVAGDVVVRRCHVSHAFNGVRLAVRDGSKKDRFNENVLVIDCHFDHIRDNAVEPESWVKNWFVVDNSFYHNHAALSFDTINGANLYVLGNRLLNYRSPGQPGDKNAGGKVFKFDKDGQKIANFVIAHNSFITRTSYAKRGVLESWLHINNAISILRQGIDAQRDRTMFGDKFKWNQNLQLSHEICNLEEFPKGMKQGENVAGIRAKEVSASEAEEFEDKRPVFELPLGVGNDAIERVAKDGLPEWDGNLTLKAGAGGEKASKPFSISISDTQIDIPGDGDMGAPCPSNARHRMEELFGWAIAESLS